MSVEEYYVELFMHTALQVKDLQVLCQLIEWRFEKTEPTVEVCQQVLRVSFWKDKLPEEDWGVSQSEFFDGLKLLGLITRWQATESIGRVKPSDEG